MPLYHTIIHTPFGMMTALANDVSLKAVWWDDDSHIKKVESTMDPNHPILVEASKQLVDYFVGRRQKFDLPIDPIGTAFQLSVWKILMEIPYGKTMSYSEIAKKIEKPLALRAVGAANAKNPMAILIPCHRVVGSNGKLPGFSKVVSLKRILIDFEKKVSDRPGSF